LPTLVAHPEQVHRGKRGCTESTEENDEKVIEISRQEDRRTTVDVEEVVAE
jgi:hypothetical protein